MISQVTYRSTGLAADLGADLRVHLLPQQMQEKRFIQFNVESMPSLMSLVFIAPCVRKSLNSLFEIISLEIIGFFCC
jgi:hypothetical protein